MKRRSLFLAACVIFAACKKKDEPIPVVNEDQIVAENEYYPTAIGNYWVYEHYEIDLHTGEETKLSLLDSIVVTGDTLINGRNYAVLKGINRPYTNSFGLVNIVRDSSAYLLNERHDILLSSENFSDTLGRFMHDDTISKVKNSAVWWMDQGETTLTVPAGTFGCIVKQTKRTFNNYQNSVVKSQNYRSCYAKGIGPVLLDYNYQYDIGMNVVEKRLVRYRVNK